MEILNSIWVEKYRPKKIDDLVLSDEYRFDFNRIIEKQEIGNLLMYGPPGSGKTTTARILTSKHGVLFNKSDNLLEINGSSKETRGIAFVDSTIIPFLKIPPAGQDKYKIVFIDESDFLTPESFHSLRNVIERFQISYGRFIFTCNYISKIPDAVQSRFTPYMFRQIPTEFILKYCKNILDSEKIEYSDNDVQFIIDNLYPDVRKIVNGLQRCSMSGKLKVDTKLITTNEKVIISSIVEIISFLEKNENSKIGKAINSIVDIVSNSDVEYRSIYTNLFFTTKIPAPAKVIVNKYSNLHNNALVPSMHFMAMVFDIIKSLQEYKQNMVRK